VPQAPSSDPISPRPRHPPPPKYSIHPSSTLLRNDEIDLNLDIARVLEKINVLVPLTKMIKIPSIINKVEKFFKVKGEPEDPHVLIQENHYRPYYDHPPFYIALELNNKW
jgi:hypothetical protein